jgi:predicted NACHT family NTPase
MTLNIFFCYAREDKNLLEKLKSHLQHLKHQQQIAFWYDGEIRAGTAWEQEIKQRLNEAHLILLLISADFMASDYCYNQEMQHALERHAKREAIVVPILLRPTDWEGAPFSRIQMLPTNAKPIVEWTSIDAALLDVAKGIRQAVKRWQGLITPVEGEAVQRQTSNYSNLSSVTQEVHAPVSRRPLSELEYLALLHSLPDIGGKVYSLAVSKDGLIAARADLNNIIKIWDLLTGDDIYMLIGHDGIIWSLAISANGKTLVSGSGDNTIKVWDLSTGKEVQTFKGHANAVHSVVMSENEQTLISGSWDKTIKVWDLSTGKERQTLTGHTGFIFEVAICENGQRLISGSTDQTVRAWDLLTGKILYTLTGHLHNVLSVAISPDGQVAVSGSSDKTIKIWDLELGKEIQTLVGSTHSVTSIAIDKDKRTLVSGSYDGKVTLWDLPTGKKLQTIDAHETRVSNLVINELRKIVVSSSDDHTIKVWKAMY